MIIYMYLYAEMYCVRQFRNSTLEFPTATPINYHRIQLPDISLLYAELTREKVLKLARKKWRIKR